MPNTPIMEEKTAIEVSNLNFFYGTFKGLKDINLNIAEHKVTAFIGPSGCGKSTLLRTLNRMYSLYPGQATGHNRGHIFSNQRRRRGRHLRLTRHSHTLRFFNQTQGIKRCVGV